MFCLMAGEGALFFMGQKIEFRRHDWILAVRYYLSPQRLSAGPCCRVCGVPI